MKLLLLTSSLGCGGAETHICALARELSLKGHRVTVVSSGGAMVKHLTEGGVTHRALPLAKKNPLSLLLARRGLSRLLKRERFDLIHAHARIPAYLAASISKKRRIPMVTTVHARFRGGRLRTRLSRWGERSIAVSEDLKHHVCTVFSLPPDHVSVIPNGIDTRFFTPSDDPAPKEALRLLFVSRLDRDCSRAAFLLCRMARELRARFPSLEIQIAGGGDSLRSLARIADRVNEEAGGTLVRLLGFVEDLRPFYRAADGVVGVSRVALEAMSCGTPVILAGNEGMLGLAFGHTLRRASASNFCCRDAAPLTEQALRREILRLLSLSPARRQELGRTLSEYARENHDLSVVAAETERFYGQVLVRRPARKPADLVLCGYYGYGNVGDDALLRASIRRAEEQYPDYTVSALTKNGKRDEPLFHVRCVSRRNPFSVLRELKRAKLLVFGGGTLLQDRTSLRSLFYYSSLLRYARRRELGIELWGNGLSLPRTERGERIIIRCLKICDHIGLRDSASLAWGLSHTPDGIRGRFFLERDLAEGTPPCSKGRSDYLCRYYRLTPPPEGDAPVGFGVVTVRGGVGRGYLKILLSWLALLRGEKIRLVFIPMLPKEDERLCRRLSSMLGGTVIAGLSPSDLVGLMSEARIVCGMRLHSLVFAASAGTPFVGFGDDPKIESFCREHGGVFFTDLY